MTTKQLVHALAASLVTGKGNHPRGLLVEPMYRLDHATQLPAQAVDQRQTPASRRRHDEDARRLVDGDEVIVSVENLDGCDQGICSASVVASPVWRSYASR